jgi:small-conductance mechanosensitive channel
MPDAHAVTAAATSQWVGAGTAILMTVVVLSVVRTVFFTPRARKLAQAVLRGELNPQIDTRLRLLERAVYAVVLTIGIAIALSQFDGVRTLGHALLTSGAITAAIVGFAARQTLANVVAGLMIAVTQPLRLGDSVRLDDHAGVVEDVTLSYTTLRTGNGVRIVIPNEKLAASVLRNESLVDAPVVPEVSVWIAPGADPGRAVAALRDATDGSVSVAEATADGIRLTVSAAEVAPPDRGAREAELRLAAVERLHAEGLLKSP